MNCTRCRTFQDAPCTMIILADKTEQEVVCETCFVTEDANWPWDHFMQVDCKEDGTYHFHFGDDDD